jgi:hypothetical protein
VALNRRQIRSSMPSSHSLLGLTKPINKKASCPEVPEVHEVHDAQGGDGFDCEGVEDGNDEVEGVCLGRVTLYFNCQSNCH